MLESATPRTARQAGPGSSMRPGLCSFACFLHPLAKCKWCNCTSNSLILANRLARLVQSGLLSRSGDPTHKQKTIYSLTEASIRLVPLLAHMGAWGCRHTPVSRELSIRAQLLEEGGKRMWEAFMAELRSTHLGARAPRRSVFAELQAAFESTISPI